MHDGRCICSSEHLCVCRPEDDVSSLPEFLPTLLIKLVSQLNVELAQLAVLVSQFDTGNQCLCLMNAGFIKGHHAHSRITPVLGI